MNCSIEQSGDWDVCTKERKMKVVQEYRAVRSVFRYVVHYVRRPVALAPKNRSQHSTQPRVESSFTGNHSYFELHSYTVVIAFFARCLTSGP